MVYHSAYNETQTKEACTCAILPLKTSVKGPAPVHTQPDQDDIVDEALMFFKANVLFRNFEVKGPADRTLCYLTLYVSSCLKALERQPNKIEGGKSLATLAMENFKIPGDAGFALSGFLAAPKDRAEGDLWRTYMKQAREELGQRLVEKVYTGPDGKASKWWMCFLKRKFMNKSL